MLPETVAKPSPETDLQQAAPPAKKRGAPKGNKNRLRHGERSTRMVLGESPPGDEYLFGKVNKWRRKCEAELVAKFGELSSIQEAKIVSACDWEISRQKHHQLARAATGAERSKEMDAKALCGERRDKCLEQAGLPTPNGNGRHSSANGHHGHNSIDLPDDVLARLYCENARAVFAVPKGIRG
jgi:hypothetical protein